MYPNLTYSFSNRGYSSAVLGQALEESRALQSSGGEGELTDLAGIPSEVDSLPYPNMHALGPKAHDFEFPKEEMN